MKCRQQRVSICKVVRGNIKINKQIRKQTWSINMDYKKYIRVSKLSWIREIIMPERIYNEINYISDCVVFHP